MTRPVSRPRNVDRSRPTSDGNAPCGLQVASQAQAPSQVVSRSEGDNPQLHRAAGQEPIEDFLNGSVPADRDDPPVAARVGFNGKCFGMPGARGHHEVSVGAGFDTLPDPRDGADGTTPSGRRIDDDKWGVGHGISLCRFACSRDRRYGVAVHGLLVSTARIIGAALGAFAGIVALQLMRLRRREFLPGWPGFAISHRVEPSRAVPGRVPLRLVVLGDSTTAGVGVSRAEDSLPYRLAQRVADAESRPVRVISYGWAGARVADLLRDQVPRAMGPTPNNQRGPFLPDADLVAIVIGSNDATHNTPPGRFRSDLRAVLEAVEGAVPNARVVLAGIPAFRGALTALEPLIFLADQYARLLRPIGRSEARRSGVTYADLHAEVAPLLVGQSGVLSSDGFHPSAIGYDAWAEVIFRSIPGESEPAVGA